MIYIYSNLPAESESQGIIIGAILSQHICCTNDFIYVVFDLSLLCSQKERGMYRGKWVNDI